MAIPNIYREGLAAGWKIIDAAKLTTAQTLEAEVSIIGNVAGGGGWGGILGPAARRGGS